MVTTTRERLEQIVTQLSGQSIQPISTDQLHRNHINTLAAINMDLCDRLDRLEQGVKLPSESTRPMQDSGMTVRGDQRKVK
jgi:hypothetical protein